MKKNTILTLIISAATAAAVFIGCEGMKKALGQGETALTAAPPSTVAKAPAPPPAPPDPFKAWDKNKYFDMLHKGYTVPTRTATAGGYTGSGTTSGKKRVLSEKEGEGLKYKLGEGRKYAVSGRGADPKVPDFVEKDDDH